MIADTMSKPQHRGRRDQRGIAALEFAVILPVLVGIMAALFLFGRFCWHYTVAQKAAHDAALYLSSVPLIDMKSRTRAEAAMSLARTIALAETSELSPGPSGMTVMISCDSWPCDGVVVPTTIRVGIRMRVVDGIFNAFTDDYAGEEGMLLTADVSMLYVGN